MSTKYRYVCTALSKWDVLTAVASTKKEAIAILLYFRDEWHCDVLNNYKFSYVEWDKLTKREKAWFNKFCEKNVSPYSRVIKRYNEELDFEYTVFENVNHPTQMFWKTNKELVAEYKSEGSL
tara:strand:+ start:1840 stop:2205 length:366 start_codon:yes stop_codon:yes gene_type:complete